MTTLVVTLKKGLHDMKIGRLIDFALEQPSVRGVTFHPIQAAGRLEQFDLSPGGSCCMERMTKSLACALVVALAACVSLGRIKSEPLSAGTSRTFTAEYDKVLMVVGEAVLQVRLKIDETVKIDVGRR